MSGAIPPLPSRFHGVALNETQGQFHLYIIKATFPFLQKSFIFGTILANFVSVALQPFITIIIIIFFLSWPLFSFLICTQSVGLLGRGISPSQCHYLHAEQHK
jgi:hypothetical protein